MVKKILLICAAIFLGANLGLISGLMPIYLIISFSINKIFTDREWLGYGVIASASLITAVTGGILAYIYTYRKKRDHEDVPLYVMCFVWSFVAAALLAAIGLYICSAKEGYRLG